MRVTQFRRLSTGRFAARLDGVPIYSTDALGRNWLSGIGPTYREPTIEARKVLSRKVRRVFREQKTTVERSLDDNTGN